ncbi:MAG: bifunctional phosphoserine phosphatase/homoserine phosphotransferase ThrH, partial [Ilumatobacteraceae bacterium]
GDSYNDTSMLGAADRGILFKSPPQVRAEFPCFTAVDEFGDLLPLILAELDAPTV